MITVSEALHTIEEKVTPSRTTETISVDNSLGRILAADCHAPISLPSFRQSVMDGYALCLHEATTYTLVGEVKAGDAPKYTLKPGEAVRIFTGAPVPHTAQAVVMQEYVTKRGNEIALEHNPKEGTHVRAIGEQIKEGALCLSKGHRINPSSIALLKSFGIQQISVSTLPKVAIVVTGSELVEAGTPLSEGKIYESNSALIRAALQQKGITDVVVHQVADSLTATQELLQDLVAKQDLVLISGGISVGDYDFVGTALRNLGVTEHFYKVLQKPGKPLFFGSKDQTYVLGLPGNPASTLTCLYVYGFALLDLWLGAEQIGLPKMELPLAETIENPFGRALFLKAHISGSEVMPLHLQQSSTVLSFAQANALLYIPANSTTQPKGALAKTLLLP